MTDSLSHKIMGGIFTSGFGLMLIQMLPLIGSAISIVGGLIIIVNGISKWKLTQKDHKLRDLEIERAIRELEDE